MTREQFENTAWRPGMHVAYKGEKYEVSGVHFFDYTVEIYREASAAFRDVECEKTEIVQP
ncbi:MAG: hypothetical protein LBR86_06040 [Tannerella sp.]|jgi:hypothetical protein|nr:hypothetical protein [Tannerella sp.]